MSGRAVRTSTAGKASKAGAAKTKAAAASTGAGEIRIIGGRFKRTRLAVAQHPGLRPTPDRVRETLFNWLGQDLTGWRCIDVFAGTGALGLEAVSRGAQAVLLVESHAQLVQQLQRHVQRLGAGDVVQLRCGDGLQALAQLPPASLDLVLIDPPFGEDAWFEPALKAARRALAPTGFVYLEAPHAWDDAVLAPLGLALHRHLKAGAVHAHLLRLADAASA